MLRYLPFLLVLAVWIYAFIDCLNTPEKEVRKLPKVVWVIVILLFGQVLLGPVAWFIVGRPRNNLPYGAADPQERRWVAPDDNPDFLKSLGKDGRGQPEQERTEQSEETGQSEQSGQAGQREQAEPVRQEGPEQPEPGRDARTGEGASAGAPGAGGGDAHLEKWEADLRRREEELRRRENGKGGGAEGRGPSGGEDR